MEEESQEMNDMDIVVSAVLDNYYMRSEISVDLKKKQKQSLVIGLFTLLLLFLIFLSIWTMPKRFVNELYENGEMSIVNIEASDGNAQYIKGEYNTQIIGTSSEESEE